METKLYVKRAVADAVAVTALLLAGAAQAALQNRDLNGDTVVDAFYDTDLDITWLRDANVNGAMDWHTAVHWADNFSFAGYADWRLPTSDACIGYDCTGSEMGHLWYTELRNRAGRMRNTGDFQNLRSDAYWSGSEVRPFDEAWWFNTGYGNQLVGPMRYTMLAFAVRSGDLAAVPEAQTYAMLLLGLGAVMVAVTRRPVEALGLRVL